MVTAIEPRGHRRNQLLTQDDFRARNLALAVCISLLCWVDLLREDVVDECGHGSRFDGASPPGSATSRIGLDKPVAGSDSDHSIGRNLPGLASLALKSRNRKSANKAGNKFRETGKTRISCSCPFARRDRLLPPDQDFRRRLADFHQRCKTGSRLSAGDRLAFGP